MCGRSVCCGGACCPEPDAGHDAPLLATLPPSPRFRTPALTSQHSPRPLCRDEERERAARYSAQQEAARRAAAESLMSRQGGWFDSFAAKFGVSNMAARAASAMDEVVYGYASSGGWCCGGVGLRWRAGAGVVGWGRAGGQELGWRGAALTSCGAGAGRGTTGGGGLGIAATKAAALAALRPHLSLDLTPHITPLSSPPCPCR